jgi:hypothetical protein
MKGRVGGNPNALDLDSQPTTNEQPPRAPRGYFFLFVSHIYLLYWYWYWLAPGTLHIRYPMLSATAPRVTVDVDCLLFSVLLENLFRNKIELTLWLLNNLPRVPVISVMDITSFLPPVYFSDGDRVR